MEKTREMEAAERQIRRRGGVLRWRTVKLKDGEYFHVAVVRKKGKRGGKTIAGSIREVE